MEELSRNFSMAFAVSSVSRKFNSRTCARFPFWEVRGTAKFFAPGYGGAAHAAPYSR